jgi:DNA polymerase II large subunit DP2.
LNELIELLDKSKSTYKQDEGIALDLSYQKRTLEVIGVPHIVRDNKIIIDKDHSYSLLVTLSKKLPQKETTIEALNEVSPVEIKIKLLHTLVPV